MVRISSGKKSKQDYGTPQYIFDYFNTIYTYTLDAAASKENAKCKKFFTEKENGLEQSWTGEMVWVNPPYNDVLSWILKAERELKNNGCRGVSFFINNDCGVNWYRYLWWMRLDKIYQFINHRVRFIGAKHSQSISSMLVHIDPSDGYSSKNEFILVNPDRPKSIKRK